MREMRSHIGVHPTGRKEIGEAAIGAFLGALAVGAAHWLVDFVREKTLKEPHARFQGAAAKRPAPPSPPAPAETFPAETLPDSEAGAESREWL